MTKIWSYLLEIAIGFLFIVFIGTVIAVKISAQKDDTVVRYKNGETRCFESMRHTTDEGFVRVYDPEKDITIPKSRVVNVQTSKSACK